MCFFATSKINITRTAVKLKIKFKKFLYISTENCLLSFRFAAIFAEKHKEST